MLALHVVNLLCKHAGREAEDKAYTKATDLHTHSTQHSCFQYGLISGEHLLASSNHMTDSVPDPAQMPERIKHSHNIDKSQ